MPACKCDQQEDDDLCGSMSARGYVYVITSSHGTKIGISICPESRLFSIRVSVPFDIHLSVVIPTDNMLKMERSLHSKFADKHIRGEWFVLDNNDIEWLKSLVPDGFITPKKKKKQRFNKANDCPF